MPTNTRGAMLVTMPLSRRSGIFRPSSRLFGAEFIADDVVDVVADQRVGVEDRPAAAAVLVLPTLAGAVVVRL